MSQKSAMSYSEDRMAEFVEMLERHTPETGYCKSSISEFFTYKATAPTKKSATIYEPFIVILGRGKQHFYLGGHRYDNSAGNYLALFLPMPIEVEVIEASVEAPLLMVGIKVDLAKIAGILLKMDQAGQPPAKSEEVSSSGIFTQPLNDALLEPVIRLLHTLDNPVERAVLGESILEEIYFRLIYNDHSGSLQRLLQHRGQVQQISKTVDHIHRHLDQAVSVDKLADMVNMSTSAFRKSFRDVMHMPPLQYAKSIKLNRAQELIREGKNASEAAYLVGYNSPAQFSREYKRQFGVVPSKVLELAAG